jgi:hypothetical protein
MRKPISWRSAVARMSLSAILLCGFLLVVQSAKAQTNAPPVLLLNTYTFNDGTSASITGTQNSGTELGSFFSCTGETCSLRVTAPVSTAPFLDFSPSATVYIAEEGGLIVSDQLVLTPLFSSETHNATGYTATFTSFDSGGVTCASVGGCAITENGLTQTAVQVSFVNANEATLDTDTINFISEDAAVATPEPSSLAMLLTGMAALGLIVGLARRKKLQDLGRCQVAAA